MHCDQKSSLMKEKLQNFIALGNTTEAIKQLRAMAPALDEGLRDEILLQSNRFEIYSREKRNGTLSHEEENIQLARITDALLSIIQRLPDEVPWTPARQVKAMKWGGILIGIITVLAAIAVLSGYDLQNLVKPEKPPIQQNTQGDQSPAVIGDEVEINYGNDWGEEENSEKPDSTQKQ